MHQTGKWTVRLCHADTSNRCSVSNFICICNKTCAGVLLGRETAEQHGKAVKHCQHICTEQFALWLVQMKHPESCSEMSKLTGYCPTTGMSCNVFLHWFVSQTSPQVLSSRPDYAQDMSSLTSSRLSAGASCLEPNRLLSVRYCCSTSCLFGSWPLAADAGGSCWDTAMLSPSPKLSMIRMLSSSTCCLC